MEDTNENNIIVNEKKTSEAIKRAKAKYYQKKKLDDGYMQDVRDMRAYKHYYEVKETNRIKEINIYLPKVIIE